VIANAIANALMRQPVTVTAPLTAMHPTGIMSANPMVPPRRPMPRDPDHFIIVMPVAVAAIVGAVTDRNADALRLGDGWRDDARHQQENNQKKLVLNHITVIRAETSGARVFFLTRLS